MMLQIRNRYAHECVIVCRFALHIFTLRHFQQNPRDRITAKVYSKDLAASSTVAAPFQRTLDIRTDGLREF